MTTTPERYIAGGYCLNPETAAGFFASRKDFFHVETVDRDDGGWDVVLRIDGTYTDSVTKRETVAYFQRWLENILSIEGITKEHQWWQPR